MNMSLFSDAFPFFRLFREQADNLRGTVKKLDELFGDFTDVLARCREIDERAAAGDRVCREIERELSLTFIESVDREDIRDLNRAFEQTFLSVRAVSSRMGLYGFSRIEKGADDLASCLSEMASELGPLVELVVRKGAGAAGRERIRKLREEAGMFLLVGLGAVYESAGAEPARLLDAIKWGQVYDRLEEVANCLERVAHIIERMILKKV